MSVLKLPGVKISLLFNIWELQRPLDIAYPVKS